MRGRPCHGDGGKRNHTYPMSQPGAQPARMATTSIVLTGKTATYRHNARLCVLQLMAIRMPAPKNRSGARCASMNAQVLRSQHITLLLASISLFGFGTTGVCLFVEEARDSEKECFARCGQAPKDCLSLLHHVLARTFLQGSAKNLLVHHTTKPTTEIALQW